ncbi:MAG: hypothetical protein KKB90_11535 [Actinobacteria bacterium]|nr:hypothetical protein [Actinomycetota bacterium]MCG2818253.1 hypothetical protein [Actinomycetes bacterium]MBU4219577.1 hypothetical protein [Actinomycetota bacterium]MBU4358790.1 hypothetical protein [Actinomycetota bacterium]MBU4391431.1 hypothetical protein [Actinomycetota bacterium]
MSRRVLVIIICSLVLAVLILSASAVQGEGTSVSVNMTMARTIQVVNGGECRSNVPVVRQVCGGFVTFISR